MGCEREAVLRLLAKLEYELAEALKGCPCRDKALERLLVYEAEIKELLREEPTFGK